jgi:hypothetical protein
MIAGPPQQIEITVPGSFGCQGLFNKKEENSGSTMDSVAVM